MYKLNLNQKITDVKGNVVVEPTGRDTVDAKGNRIPVMRNRIVSDIVLAALSIGRNLTVEDMLKRETLIEEVKKESQIEVSEEQFAVIYNIMRQQQFYETLFFINSVKKLNPDFDIENYEKSNQ